MTKYHLTNRPNRELRSHEEINSILLNGKYVVISMCRENEPYIVTLSYGLDLTSHTLFFHSSSKGLKLDFLATNKNVCATVIEDGGYINDECAHEYRSVVFWGEMQIVQNLEEKKHGMSILLHHLEKKDTVIKEKLLKSDDYYSKKMEILKLEIKQIHGKAGR